jgi:hypothetical protein
VIPKLSLYYKIGWSRVVSQAAGCWILISEASVHSRVTPCEIRDGSVVIGARSSSNFFCFPMLIIILPLASTHLSQPLKTCTSTGGSALSHRLSLNWGLHLWRGMGAATEKEVGIQFCRKISSFRKNNCRFMRSPCCCVSVRLRIPSPQNPSVFECLN